MIKAENIFKSFNNILAIKDLSISISRGEIIGLAGPSGSGKSVLIKLLSKVMSPDKGKIVAEDKKDLRVGVLFQEGALFDSMSILENVSFPLLNSKKNFKKILKEEAYTRAFKALEDVGLLDAYKKNPSEISGGMKRRVGIARALVSRPDLVLLDDPTGGLDPVTASVILRLVRELQQKYNLTVILASHDIRRLIPNVKRLVVLFEGEIRLDSIREEIYQNASSQVIRFLSTRYDFKESEGCKF